MQPVAVRVVPSFRLFNHQQDVARLLIGLQCLPGAVDIAYAVCPDNAEATGFCKGRDATYGAVMQKSHRFAVMAPVKEVTPLIALPCEVEVVKKPQSLRAPFIGVVGVEDVKVKAPTRPQRIAHFIQAFPAFLQRGNVTESIEKGHRVVMSLGHRAFVPNTDACIDPHASGLVPPWMR